MRPRLAGALTLLVGLSPSMAAAHQYFPGAGAFVNGAIHPFVVPAHLLTLAGAGLWLGRRPLDDAGPALVSFAAALAAGLLLSNLLPWSGWQELVLLLLAIGAGATTAAGWIPSRRLAPVLPMAIAAVVGLDSPADESSDVLVAAAGTWLAVYILFLNLTALTSLAKRPWLAIAVRVLASWVTAIALIVLALSLRQL